MVQQFQAWSVTTKQSRNRSGGETTERKLGRPKPAMAVPVDRSYQLRANLPIPLAVGILRRPIRAAAERTRNDFAQIEFGRWQTAFRLGGTPTRPPDGGPRQTATAPAIARKRSAGQFSWPDNSVSPNSVGRGKRLLIDRVDFLQCRFLDFNRLDVDQFRLVRFEWLA